MLVFLLLHFVSKYKEWHCFLQRYWGPPLLKVSFTHQTCIKRDDFRADIILHYAISKQEIPPPYQDKMCLLWMVGWETTTVDLKFCSSCIYKEGINQDNSVACTIKPVNQETYGNSFRGVHIFLRSSAVKNQNNPCLMCLVYFQPNISICVSQTCS